MHESPSFEKTLQELLVQSLSDLSLSPSTSFSVHLEVPKNPQHGDLSSNCALWLARQKKKPPMEIAQAIAQQLRQILPKSPHRDAVKTIQVVPPGFINFFLTERLHQSRLSEILSDLDYGQSRIGEGIPVQIEFVSANPTGPLSVAHGRQAAIGDSLCRILAFCGHPTTREYYVNDVGYQIELLGHSLKARYRQLLGEAAPLPEGGYQGEYLVPIAEEFLKTFGERYRKSDDATPFKAFAIKQILAMIQKDLEDFGVHFDAWTYESDIRKEGAVEKVLAELKKREVLFEREGATWFRSSAFGDEKDRVVVKSDGSLTYLAPDIAYHQEKFRRGFKRLINLWGPDHHGYIPRLKAALQALGHPVENLSILIVQLATLFREGKEVRMSTRLGQLITLREVMEEVGRDAARFFFLMKKLDSHLDFDLELAKRQSLENPVYYIQYAYARSSSLLQFGRERLGSFEIDSVDISLLKTEEELELLKTLRLFPQTILSSARQLEPSLLIVYLQKLAGFFHRFYQKHRVVTEDMPLSRARFLLVQCVRQNLAKGLSLLGVSHPDQM